MKENILSCQRIHSTAIPCVGHYQSHWSLLDVHNLGAEKDVIFTTDTALQALKYSA